MLKNEPFSFLFKKLWRFSPDRRGKIILAMSLQIGAALLELFPPLILAYIFNLIQQEGLGKENIWIILGVLAFNYLIFPIIIWMFWYPSRILERKTAFLAKINFRDYLIQGVLSLNMKWHNNQKSGKVIDKVNKATDELYNFSDRLFSILETSIKLFGSLFMILFFYWRFIFIVPIFIIIALLIIRKFDKKLVPRYKLLSKKENAIQEKIFDNISNITTVKILQLEKVIRKIVHKISCEPLSLDHEKNLENESKWMYTDIFSSLFLFIVVGFYIWWQYSTSLLIEIGTLTALIQYLDRFKIGIFGLADKMNSLMIQKARVQNAESLEKDFAGVLKTKFRKKLSKKWQRILIPNLTFQYEDNKHQKHAVKIKNLEFSRGEKVALLGESGSGKTTFLKLLRGLYDLKNLDLEIDKNNDENNFTKLHNSSMLVPQEPEIFATTIKENIDMHSGVSIKKLEKFVDIARFDKVLDRLPAKWKSIVGEKGVNLSGGEKQRLALARALLFCENKEVILLDESTSSVDSINEIKIYQSVFREFKQKTIFASIHKLNLVPEFDRIILFEKGEIVADGSFSELLKSSQNFKKIWKSYEKSKKQIKLKISRDFKSDL